MFFPIWMFGYSTCDAQANVIYSIQAFTLGFSKTNLCRTVVHRLDTGMDTPRLNKEWPRPTVPFTEAKTVVVYISEQLMLLYGLGNEIIFCIPMHITVLSVKLNIVKVMVIIAEYSCKQQFRAKHRKHSKHNKYSKHANYSKHSTHVTGNNPRDCNVHLKGTKKYLRF